MPFYPSPLRDDGYDIADYKNINPSYGRMHDFKAFVREAHRRDLRVITELVINHTSDQHPWFQRARQAKPGSAWRDFYVWSDTDQKFPETRVIFVDSEKSNWAWDPVAQAYYWHRFYAHQPDLNFDNPRVFRAVAEVMKFWLDLGVDGLRLDAVPYLIEREGTTNENLPETHEILRRLRRELDHRYGDRMLLAEANQWPEDVLQYFGAGDECHMAFHFPLMPRIYMAVSTEDRHPVTDIMRQTPDIPDSCQWAVFLRNHDELTLEMVTDRERDYLWNHYAADRRARINLGIRRRLAPLMENDRRRIELLNALLISMPGTPVIYYGDEIGMGDNVFLRDRDGVRTPMQWTFDRNGGFSRTDPERLYLPPIMDSVYGFEAVNVEAQSRSPSSLVELDEAPDRGTPRAPRLWPRHLALSLSVEPQGHRLSALLRRRNHPVRRQSLALAAGGRARSRRIPRSPAGRAAGAQRLSGDRRAALSADPARAQLLLVRSAVEPAGGGEPADATARIRDPGDAAGLVRSVSAAQSAAARRRHHPGVSAAPTLVRRQGPADPASRDRGARRNCAPGAGWRPSAKSYLASVVEVSLRGAGRRIYFVPCAAVWSPSESDLRQGLVPVTLAELRQFRREGALVDALSQDGFSLALMDAIAREATLPLDHGEIRCVKTPAYDQALPPERLTVRRGGVEQSNSSVFFDEYGMLKLYRQLGAGPHPEIEMSRFLVEKAGFANTPPPLATIELMLDSDGGPQTMALGVLFGFVRNQGDGWTQALNYLTRYLDDALVSTGQRSSELPDPDLFFLALARQIGIRTGEMHRALAEKRGDDPDFAPEPITRDDIAQWRQTLEAEATAMLALLERERARLPERASEPAAQLLAARDRLFAEIRTLLPDEVAAQKTRFHGDYHLGQTIVVQNDFFIVDFEGEPSRPVAERRAKSSPLRDVAGMIRSFDYAAVAAVRQLAETRAAAEPRMAELAESWRQRAVDGFRAAYRKTMRGCAAYPASKRQARDLTAFFILEKAVYEVSYELANRPSWVDIPLQGVLGILNRRKVATGGEAD